MPQCLEDTDPERLSDFHKIGLVCAINCDFEQPHYKRAKLHTLYAFMLRALLCSSYKRCTNEALSDPHRNNAIHQMSEKF